MPKVIQKFTCLSKVFSSPIRDYTDQEEDQGTSGASNFIDNTVCHQSINLDWLVGLMVLVHQKQKKR